MIALELTGLAAGYGAIDVVRSLNLTVGSGEIVALLGANGAGKTTTLRAISGALKHTGSVRLDGAEIGNLSAAKRTASGLAHIPQGRGTFVDFTVEENLHLGAYTVSDRRQIEQDLARWYAAFPRLKERKDQFAGSLSGGEQQMLAIARGLMTEPDLLVIDELSLGLAPKVVEQLIGILRDLNRQGLTILLVEQLASYALAIADHAYVVAQGRVVRDGPSGLLARDPEVMETFLGKKKAA
jgi:branched-chain amino acid transport system ATP-binding protein